VVIEMSIKYHTLRKSADAKMPTPNHFSFTVGSMGKKVFTFYGGRKYHVKRVFHFGKQVKRQVHYKGFLIVIVNVGRMFGKHKYEWRFSPKKQSVKQFVARKNAKERVDAGWKMCYNGIEYDNTSYTSINQPKESAMYDIVRMINPMQSLYCAYNLNKEIFKIYEQ
jgi:hypothetical protein